MRPRVGKDPANTEADHVENSTVGSQMWDTVVPFSLTLLRVALEHGLPSVMEETLGGQKCSVFSRAAEAIKS